MIRFQTYLNEATGANLHMTHLEDAILDGGVIGTRNVFRYLQALRDMLGGNTKAPVSLSVKWDGAPAIFAGKDPSDGKFFIAKKGLFNKNPKFYKTAQEIDDDKGLAGELNSKFKTALAEFSKLGIEGVVQGDLLYTKNDLKTENIGGESCVTFHPNTIVYAVPVDSNLGKQIQGSEIGVVWHTTYRGADFETMSASFGQAISSKLKEVRSVWHVDAVFKDESGNVTFTEKETKAFNKLLSDAGRIFRTIKPYALNELSNNKELNMRVNVFINKKVREGQRIKNVPLAIKGMQEFIKEYYEKEASKVKSQVAKDRKYATRDDVLKYFDKTNIKEVNKVFQLYNLLVDAKMIVIAKLNHVEGLKTLLKTKDGFEVTGQEGFVAIDHVGKSALKLVDRLNFSNANFSTKYIKGWQK